MASLGCCDISIQESLLFYKLSLVKKINFSFKNERNQFFKFVIPQ